jgi:NAD(P)-dependent dehydrogenase (short-subunit alcohol dehydrogenase family)
MDTTLDFSGKVIIVTGSSSGIGEGIALLFSKLGGSVVITGRNEANLARVADECAKVSPKGLQPLSITADVSIDEDAKSIIGKTVQTLGRIDVLVNNAGIFKMTRIGDPDMMRAFDSVMSTNLRSVVLLSHEAIPHLVQTKGSIINISSCASTRTGTDKLGYSTSKAAVDMVTKVLALELGPKGVRVNGINPSVIKTPIFENNGLSKEMTDKLYGAAAKIYPVGRVGETEDVASAVAFLASEKATFITGVNLPVDGGYTCTSRQSTDEASKQ